MIVPLRVTGFSRSRGFCDCFWLSFELRFFLRECARFRIGSKVSLLGRNCSENVVKFLSRKRGGLTEDRRMT